MLCWAQGPLEVGLLGPRLPGEQRGLPGGGGTCLGLAFWGGKKAGVRGAQQGGWCADLGRVRA